MNSKQVLQQINNKSEEQEGEGKNRNVEKDSKEVRGEDDMAKSSEDSNTIDSGVVTIGEDTTRSE